MNSFRFVAVDISNDFISHGHVVDLCVVLENQLGCTVLLILYKAQIRTNLECCSYIWGASAPTACII